MKTYIESKIENMVKLPYQPDVYLCPLTQTRWILKNKELYRDFDGEGDWVAMAKFVGKTYQEVFNDSYKYALSV